MNQIETWFSILTRQAIRRGCFRSVEDLTHAITEFTRTWNDSAAPFVCVKSADQILANAIKKPPKGNSGA